MKFFKRNKRGLIQYANYSVIGLLCAALDLLVLNTLLVLFPTKDTSLLMLFNTIAYTAAVTNSYIWNSKYTFKVRKSKKQLIPFISQAIVSMFIANGIFLAGIWLLDKLPLFPGWVDTNIAKGISMYASFQASFFFNKYIVFRTTPLFGKNKEEEDSKWNFREWKKRKYSQNSRW
ncbi:GtrA family protein [Planococcus lenghuensis]|uniref:GtrA/DPMS transmembrane domain-containing protein n=1 Tax=Planococcus lenghuensis TaxID=2213202 RepID=A0A1Q2KZ70_9BACL|nr:GtrA family protein [Planococcus lenghuensis]AQQ53463.1 hypothetical protein B0X71_10515 [Planococcus lenghuensis]